jgi:hypothetical protein
LRYYPREGSPFWMEVVSEGDGHIETRKYRGEELVCQTSRSRRKMACWAEKDRNALLCQLNSYLAGKEKEGVA